jgi:membrane fusion protein (multidrug efflux system)
MNALSSTAPVATDFPSYAPDVPATGVKPRSRLPWAKVLGASAALAIAVSAIASYLHYAAGFEATDDSFLEGDVHPVSARINGTVSRILVDDNAHVEAGQPLVEIDPSDLRLALVCAQADLAQAGASSEEVGAQIARAQADVDAAGARVAQNAAQLRLAELDFHRTETLVQNGAVSTQAFDAARATFDAARASQQSLESAQASVRANLESALAQKSVAAAQVQRAQASLQLAQLQVSYTVIRAPSAGRVAKKSVEVGQRLQPGQPMLAIVSDQVWVVANFKENQLAGLHPGERAEVRIDAVKNRVFEGVVQSFSPGTGAQFSLLPPDNATGNFTKVVQRLPVKILLADGSLDGMSGRLSPGLSANVKVSVRE